MERIHFDSGIQEFQIGEGGVLRFNPCDPNLYVRFLEAAEKIKAVEENMAEQAKLLPENDGAAVGKLLQQADTQMKQILNWVFGETADFDRLLGGVNLLAMGANGERVVSNLFEALQPVLLSGAKKSAAQQVKAAKTKAKTRRASQ
ncbi:MAG: hypothetical protein IIX23_00335 [Oscillospiraceae bacterium]|nr:hypothetical protein [Oscillospiraceae bacterium]